MKVCHDDFACTGAGGDGGAEAADGSGPGDQHALALKVARHLACVETDGQRFGAGDVADVGGFGELDALGRLDHDAVAEQPLHVGQSHGGPPESSMSTQ